MSERPPNPEIHIENPDAELTDEAITAMARLLLAVADESEATDENKEVK